MKRVLRFGAISLLLLLTLVAIAAVFLAIKRPAQRPTTAVRIERTPARLARGTYLVEHVTDCLGCHSDHLTTFGIPVKPGTEGMGGFLFDEKLGIPGVVAAQNITPDRETGIGGWSDDEVIRAVREGIDRNGDPLFPMMPYEHFRVLGDEDARAIVVYLRTLKPIRHSVQAKHLNFPVSVIVKFIPKPLEGRVEAPDPANAMEYGHYLTEIAGCVECHTPHDDKNQRDLSRPFAGGWEMRGPWGRVITANITPHPQTFVGRSSKQEFIGRFRAFARLNASNSPVPQPGRNTVMPWLAFSGMTDHDLGAIYDYLRSVKPLENRIDSFPEATPR